MQKTIRFYNQEVDRFAEAKSTVDIERFVDTNPNYISWTRALRNDVARGRKASLAGGTIRTCHYRPFHKQNLFFSRQFNEIVGQMEKVFPREDVENRVICVTGIGSQRGYSVFMSENLTDLQIVQNGQCFPLYLYEPEESSSGLFASQEEGGYARRSAITKWAMQQFRSRYADTSISAEQIFYYAYGLLHSPEYSEKFGENLQDSLPRIPLVRTVEDFRLFETAGRKLADCHVKFESVEPYPVTFREGDLSLAIIEDAETFYRVEKMKFGGKRPILDKTTVHYNPRITMTNIPLEAYDYLVNGKPALEWVMERQVVKTDKDSGIVNDANRYAIETVGDPAYPLKLFQRVITVSLETMKIVRSLPVLDIMPEAEASTSTTH